MNENKNDIWDAFERCKGYSDYDEQIFHQIVFPFVLELFQSKILNQLKEIDRTMNKSRPLTMWDRRITGSNRFYEATIINKRSFSRYVLFGFWMYFYHPETRLYICYKNITTVGLIKAFYPFNRKLTLQSLLMTFIAFTIRKKHKAIMRFYDTEFFLNCPEHRGEDKTPDREFIYRLP